MYYYGSNTVELLKTLMWDYGSTTGTMEALLELWKDYWKYGSTTGTMEALLQLWKHYCNYGSTKNH